jgi:prepilin-type N-terminal cleavage/methylation domain-containing protein
MKRLDQQGFTLIELLITLTITVAIMTVVLTAVDLNANISRVQSDVSDLQQSTRVAQRDMQRLVRMVGRGGLPLRQVEPVSDTSARLQVVEVTQGATDLQVGGQNVVDNTDILTIRGAFSSPVFRVDAADPASFQVTGNTATLLIDDVTKSAFDQPLNALHALYDEGNDTTTPEAILLVSSAGDTEYAVVELTDIEFQTVTLDVQNQARQVERAILTLSVAAGVSPNAEKYLLLSSNKPPDPPGTFPSDLTSVSFASVLEEYKLFIREDFTIPGDATSLPTPKLARARMLPNTDILHPDGAIDIADNVIDLQVALGIDLDGNGRIDIEDAGGSPLATNADEWWWNDPADDPDPLTWDNAPLQHIRLTLVGQAQTADRTYISPALTDIENHAYNEPEVPGNDQEVLARRYRRRVLQSIIDLRNL